MKFLLMIRERQLAAPVADPVGLNRACRSWFGAQLESGVIDCAYYIAPRAGMCIMNASSHEALLEQMRSFPAFGSSDIDIHILVDAVAGIDGNQRRILREQASQQRGETP